MNLDISLNKNDIKDLTKQLEDYNNMLKAKCGVFVQRLADIGINVAMTTLAFDGIGDAPRDADFGFTLNDNGSIAQGVIRVSGSGLLFWEFGAGNEFNGMTSPNPKAKEFGMGPGTYPNQRHVPEPGFWYYYDGSGEAVRSYGTQATMPMYKASVEIMQRAREIAKEVFV